MHSGIRTLISEDLSCGVVKLKLKCFATMTIQILNKKGEAFKTENNIQTVKHEDGSIILCGYFSGK